jgi:hypothetical protein
MCAISHAKSALRSSLVHLDVNYINQCRQASLCGVPLERDGWQTPEAGDSAEEAKSCNVKI